MSNKETSSEDRRVVILVDTQTHMMPALAREMARRNHNLVIGTVADGLADELKGTGAEVEVVPGDLDLSQASSMQKLVEAAQTRFGRIDSACVRTGVHGTGDIFQATPEEFQIQFEGNMQSVLHALNALLLPMVVGIACAQRIAAANGCAGFRTDCHQHQCSRTAACAVGRFVLCNTRGRECSDPRFWSGGCG